MRPSSQWTPNRHFVGYVGYPKLEIQTICPTR